MAHLPLFHHLHFLLHPLVLSQIRGICIQESCSSEWSCWSITEGRSGPGRAELGLCCRRMLLSGQVGVRVGRAGRRVDPK